MAEGKGQEMSAVYKSGKGGHCAHHREAWGWWGSRVGRWEDVGRNENITGLAPPLLRKVEESRAVPGPSPASPSGELRRVLVHPHGGDAFHQLLSLWAVGSTSCAASL